MYRFTAPVTISALAAAAEEELTITETNVGRRARVGDGVVINLPATPEAGLSIAAAWVQSPGVIKFRISNLNTAVALTAGAVNFTVTVLR
jgi:hypothetical protein